MEDSCPFAYTLVISQGGQGVLSIYRGGIGVAPLVQAATVVAETKFSLLQEADFPLGPGAKQIREKRAQVKKVETKIVGERVVLEGVLQGEVYYAGKDNRVHHYRQEISFQDLVSLPGASPGMDVWVECQVEDFLLSQPAKSARIQGKIFLGGEIIVTKKENLRLVPGSDYLLQLPVVVAAEGEEVLVQHRLYPSPQPLVLGSMEAEFQGLRATAMVNQVAVEGRIGEDLYYTGSGEIEYHWQESVPFRVIVPVLGTEGGDEVEIEGRVKETFLHLEEDGSLTVKVMGELLVQVCRRAQLAVKRGPVPIRALQVRGENTRERLLTDSWLLRHEGRAVRSLVGQVKKLKGQAISGQVLLEGILQKEVTYIGAADGVEYHQVKEVPLTDFLPLPVAKEGLLVQTSAQVTPGGWRLLGEQELEDRMILEFYGVILEAVVVYVAVET